MPKTEELVAWTPPADSVPAESLAAQDPRLNAALKEIERQRADPKLGPTLKGMDRFRYVQGLVPFLGDAVESSTTVQAMGALGRIANGAGSGEDYGIAADFIDREQRAQQAAEKSTVLGKAADVVAHLPKYGTEFALTGGAAGGGKAIAGGVAKRALGSAAKSAAGKMAAGAVGNLAGVAAQTAANPTMVASAASRRMGPGDDFLQSLPAGYLDAAIEIGSERTGGALAGAAGKIPGVAKIEAIKNGIINRWFSKPGRTTQMLEETFKQAGWNGIVGEVLEERAGDVARMATGLESPAENVTGQLATGRFQQALEQLAVEGLSFSVPGALSVASRGLQARRLEELQAIRAKGYVSAEDGKAAGIPGETRKERLAAADAEIEQLAQEVLNAEQEQIPAPPDVSGGPRVEAEVQPGTEPSGGEEVPGGGQVPREIPEQEVGTEAPAVEGTPQILRSQELLDWLSAAEAAAPEVQAEATPEPLSEMRPIEGIATESPEALPEPAEQPPPPEESPAAEKPPPAEPPKPDIASEIRSALAEGPVTVATPKVPSGFKIAKVRDDGRVVTKRGRILTPDETWTVKRPETPAAAEAVALYEVQGPENTTARVFKHDKGFSVAVKDEDSGNTLPQISTFPTLEKAKAHADTIKPQAVAKKTGRKEIPSSPPELAQAGITVKSTSKGWSVTGIPQEIADGLSIDYQGKRTGNGHFFRKDPRPGLVDAARTIAAEAERDAAERASGRVKTSIGYHEPEIAEEFERQKAERLTLAKQDLQRQNDAKDELLAQVIPTATRGQWKLNLMRVAEKGGDEANIPNFDLLVDYSKNHPELGLPTEGHKLFALLANESFTKSDAEMVDEIEQELAAEFEKALGDESFDFGANEAEPEAPATKQTAIPGTEKAVANQERREEIKQARKQFTTPKEKQKAFISGLGKDLPGQETMFDVDGLDGGEGEAGRPAPKQPDEPPQSPSKLQQAADAAIQEAYESVDELGRLIKKRVTTAFSGVDPEAVVMAGKVVYRFAKAGTYQFAAMMEQLAKRLGQAAADGMEAVLGSEWDRVQKSGEFPGMEPRTVETTAEPQPLSGEDLTSIKKEIVNEMREMAGLPEMEGSTEQTVEEWAETARVTLAADPKAAIRLVNELATNPRPISQHDAMLLQFRYRQLANELKPVVDDFFAAVESKDPVAIATARSALIGARKTMTEFEEIIHPSKETWGRTGVALQQMLRKDFSIEAILRRGQEANEGEDLSPEQTAELTKLSRQLEDLQKQFDEQRRKNEALEAELASKKQHEETVTRVKQEKVRRKSDRLQVAEKKVADAWANFRKAMGTSAGSSGANLLGPAVDLAKAYVELGYVRFGEFMAAVRKNMPDADEKLFRQAWDQVTPETPDMDLTDRTQLSKAAREIQRRFVELGMTEREQVIDAVYETLKEELPDLTRRQTMDALSRYGQFQRQSQDEIEKLIRGMNSEILKLSQIDQIEKAMKRVDELRAAGKTDEEIGKALADEKLLVEATGLVRDRPSQTIRQLTQKYNELKKALPTTPAGKAGLLQTALAQIERGLLNRIQDLRWEIEHGEKSVREHRERPTSESVKALEAERDALLKIHREMFPPRKKTLTEAQKIANAIRGADKTIEYLEQQLETRSFDRERRAPLSSPELNSRRARIEQLRAAREAAKAFEVARMEGEGGRPKGKVPLSDAEIARRGYEASLRSRIADYQQILAEGDFSPKPKKGPRELSASELKLKREMEDVRHKVLQKYADYHLAHLKGIAWGADKIAEAAHLSRALMTSFDMSALLRQGGLPAMGHPVLAKRALFETVASIARNYNPENAGALRGGVNLENINKFLHTIDSRQAEFDFMHKLTEGPDGEFRLRASLNLPSTDQAITRQEEAFQGRWGKKIPGIALSSRLYTMILNKLRADLFDSMVQNLGRGGKVTMDEAKTIANFVNVATGRADLGKLNSYAAMLNTVFFAPRYVASRFQYLAMPFYLPFQGGSWRVKRVIYQEYGRTAAGIGTVLGIFALIGQLLYDDDDDDRPRVETDARSSDFLKVRIGETRLDFLAGMAQTLVLSQRLLPEFLGGGAIKSSVTGKVTRFGEGKNPQTRLTVLGRFGRSKLAPIPGAIATVADDWTDIVGQEQTPLSLVWAMSSPLSVKDVATTMRTQGIAKGTAMSLLSILGVGMNTYGPRTQYVTGTPEERLAQVEKDLKAVSWDSPDPAYSEFLTEGQLKQFEQRRREKRGLVIYNSTYSGKNEDEIATRDKNREYLTEMGVSFEDARELLQGHYRRPDDKGRTGRITEGYFPRLRELRRIYGQ